MTAILTILGKIKDRERKMLEVFFVVVIATYLNLTFILPKWEQIKVKNKDLLTYKNQITLSQKKTKILTNLEGEKQKLSQVSQDLMAKQNAMNILTQANQPQDFVNFFNDWTRFAKENEVKIISFKPAKPDENKGNTKLAKNEVGVNVKVEANFISLLNFFTKLDIYGRVPKLKNFTLITSEKGYPHLAGNIEISLVLK